MSIFDTGPVPTNRNILQKSTIPSSHLLNLVIIKSWLGAQKRRKVQLKKLVVACNPKESIDFAHETVYFRQNLTGRTFEEVIDDFNQSGIGIEKTVVHYRIEISPRLPMQQEQWYFLIRYCLYCWGQQNSPAVIFASPNSSRRIDLFILEKRGINSHAYSSYERWLINQLVSIQVALEFMKIPTNYMDTHCLTYQLTEANYILYLTSAIYYSLTQGRAETIHMLKDKLQKKYGIKTSFRCVDTYFSDLKFGFEWLPWVDVGELTIGAQEIRIWLDFNRLFKLKSISDRLSSCLYKIQV